MGKLIGQILGDEIVGRVSIDGENGVPKTFAELGHVDADVVIDFSHHSAISDVLAYGKAIGAAVVVGTTGHTEEEKAQIKEIFQKTAELNTVLDKYDTESKFDWEEYFILVGQYFDATRL
jgi:dihydrodipicolinate reductase